MHGNRETDLRELHNLVANAQYRVDPVAVADAIVRRRWSVFVAPKQAPVCSIAPRLSGATVGGEPALELLAA
jgi:hypothetical protein